MSRLTLVLAHGGEEGLRVLEARELADLLAMPWEVQKHVGKPLTKRSKFDFRVRVYAAQFMLPYQKVPKSSKGDFLTETWKKIVARFPDLDLTHPRRKADLQDPKLLAAWETVSNCTTCSVGAYLTPFIL